MEWSGRAPAPPAIEAGKGRESKERAMSHNPSNAVDVIGIDIGKNSFHVVGLDSVAQSYCVKVRVARSKHGSPRCRRA